jgi:uncharacterized membrane protein YczE
VLRGSRPVRIVALLGGLVVVGAAIVAMLESRLGLPPWDVLHQGVSRHTPMSLGVASIAVGLVMLAVAWAAGQPPGVGTLANAVVIGVTVDALSSVDAVERLSAAALPARIGLLVAGVLLFGVGSAFYIGAGMGAGPRDSLMIALARRTGRRIGIVRGAMEVAVLATGLLLGGTAGLGTIALAVLVGPVVEACFWALLVVGIATPQRIDAVGVLDVG